MHVQRFFKYTLHYVLHQIVNNCKGTIVNSLQTQISPTFTDVPGAPGKPKTSDVDATKMTVTWTAPESDGGAPITGYYVERKEATSSRWTRITKESLLDITLRAKDLMEKSKYEFRVLAENKAGVGPPSEPSDLTMAKLPFGKYSGM